MEVPFFLLSERRLERRSDNSILIYLPGGEAVLTISHYDWNRLTLVQIHEI